MPSGLRLRLSGAVVLAAAASGLAIYAAYRFAIGLSAIQVQEQLWTWLANACLFIVTLVGMIYSRLGSVERLLHRLKRNEPVDAEALHRAHTVALQFPATFALAGLAVGAVAAVSMLLLDVWFFELKWSLAVGLTTAILTLSVAVTIMLYLLARRSLRELLTRIQQERLPSRRRIPLAAKVTVAITASCLAVAVSAGVLSRSWSNQTNAHLETRLGKGLARIISHSSRFLSPDALRQSIATIDASRAHVSIVSEQTPLSAPLDNQLPKGYVAVKPRDATNANVGTLTAIVCFALIFALLLAIDLGTLLATDVRVIERRIASATATADSTQVGNPEEKTPNILPEFTEIEQLVRATNGLLARFSEINVSHFVATERILEADRVKNQFLANMSHDLRGPLNSVLGFSELLLSGHGGALDDSARAELNQMFRTGKRLLRLINAILDAAKVEVGRLGLYKEDFLPSDLAQRCITELRATHPEVRVESSLQAGLAPLWADGRRIVQAMVYILEFCLENAASEGSDPQVALRSIKLDEHPTADRALEIQISHTRLREARAITRELTPKARGIAIGLPLAQAIARLHGGKLVFDSGGQRPTFKLQIPLQNKAAIGRLRPVRV